ncbi:hypothetical protein SAMN05444156_2161 [Verrucomicrobium sp. GAS474]|uniref:hypothetical protein n=1 Tax=Verrucomicrobium sp. GAS474 TaxID=1882831 RepID=UPI00087CEADA|nr:hypothetical protein [Verrucomicrobium sp. GAS474]SDU13411.1 hypothetical protein SAMN05444156_2161 [Verrucomicrobium sp. GAS474]
MTTRSHKIKAVESEPALLLPTSSVLLLLGRAHTCFVDCKAAGWIAPAYGGHGKGNSGYYHRADVHALAERLRRDGPPPKRTKGSGSSKPA